MTNSFIPYLRCVHRKRSFEVSVSLPFLASQSQLKVQLHDRNVFDTVSSYMWFWDVRVGGFADTSGVCGAMLGR